jgi:hypothetical protein
MQKMFPKTAIVVIVVALMGVATSQTALLSLSEAEAAQDQELCRTSDVQGGGTLTECVDKKEDQYAATCVGTNDPPCFEHQELPKHGANELTKIFRESCKDTPDKFSCEKVKSDSTPGF